MSPVRALLFCAALGAPAHAQAPAAPTDPGAVLEGLARSMREALEALSTMAEPWAETLGPVLADPGAWHPPETLPNGDILIRRRTPAPEQPAPEQAPAPDGPGLDL